MGVATTVAGLALALTGTLVRADETHWTATPEGYAAHLSSVEAWEFSAKKKGADGKPECYETWTFNADGSGSVLSGEQELVLSWKYYKHDILGILLHITFQSSTTGKDCMGRAVDPSRYPRDNGNGIKLLFFGEGKEAFVCNAPQVMTHDGEIQRGPNGAAILYQSMENCWGNLEPASAN